jgi:hypothetical protein
MISALKEEGKQNKASIGWQKERIADLEGSLE